MIAGQKAEAAGVVGDAFMKTEFGGEIGDAISAEQLLLAHAFLAVDLIEPGCGLEIAVERFRHAVHVRQKALVVQQVFEALLRDRGKKLDRAMLNVSEKLVIDSSEE